MTSPLPRLPTGWKASLDALGQCPFLEEILGLEGSAARGYFQAVRGLIDPVWGFEGRQRRPPPDPVNAMLSYGYTLLVHEVVAALETAGLDPMLGYLHRHRRGWPALAPYSVAPSQPKTPRSSRSPLPQVNTCAVHPSDPSR